MKVLQASALSVLVLMSSACWRGRQCCGPRMGCAQPVASCAPVSAEPACETCIPGTPYAAPIEVAENASYQAPVIVEEEPADELSDIDEVEAEEVE